MPVGGGEHGGGGVEHFAFDAGGFVDDEEMDGGDAADVGFFAGDGENAGAVGEEKADAIDAVAGEVNFGAFEEKGGFEE